MSQPLELSFIDEDEGTPDTWGWYIVDQEGGALGGPFSMKDEALAELAVHLPGEPARERRPVKGAERSVP